MSLSEVLKNLREYVSNPDSIVGSGDFSAPRDSHYLVSAQHVFVPIAERGKVEFTPVIFNHQSSAGRPAVLTLLVTRQGTSVVAIDNATDAVTSGYTAGQALYFNHKGAKTTLTAERRSTVQQRIDSGQATEQDAGALDEGADLMLIVPSCPDRADLPYIDAEDPQKQRGAGGPIGWPPGQEHVAQTGAAT